MWIEWLETKPYITTLEFQAPAAADDLDELETSLGAPLPRDLRDLLLETDGIDGEYGLGVIWPCARIRHDNLLFRSNPDFAELYMRFDSLMFFGDAGNGDQFATRVLAGNPDDDVYVWDHESDNRIWIARDVRAYLDGWLSGTITI